MLPKWAKFIFDKYKGNISNSFLLTGNIGDYVAGRSYLKDFLVSQFFTLKNQMERQNIYFDNLSSSCCNNCTVGGCRYCKSKKNNMGNGRLLQKQGDVLCYSEYKSLKGANYLCR